MDKYNPQKIEPKWQEIWGKTPDFYAAQENSKKEKQYILDMFPYPSGEGLHVGHVESYTATDIISRYLRMNGKNVLHPQGWDAFGLPAENYAIKTKIHPTETTKKSIETFKRQMNKMGFSYDWSREVNSSDPEYYKWTQWFFLLLYKNGWAYKKLAKANWCPSCQTVLANEQVVNGKCERCSTEVIQKDLEQWFFKITDFIEDNKKTSGLISGLNEIDWPESTKAAQKNWIGRSEGAQFKMPIADSDLFIEVYTTRLDTAYGITYAVVAPEHPIIAQLKSHIANPEEVEKYLEGAKKKTDLERMEAKEKTGVELKGIKVINPFNNEEVPIFVADYVLSHYGTGAVMAVPAHDERDFEFAKKYNLPINKSIDSVWTYVVTIKESLRNSFYKEVGSFSQMIEKDGLVHIYSEEVDRIFDLAEQNFIGGPWYIHSEGSVKKILFHTENVDKRFDWGSIEDKKLAYRHGVDIGIKEEQLDWAGAYEATAEDGVLINSKNYSGLKSQEAREKMTEWLKKNKIGEKKINYKIRDWLVSRQRYWGTPIPIIYCEHCGTIPVPEKDLPVILPTDVDFKPTGESPLKYSKKFQDVKCPSCGGKARRESDTMDTFVCSSWYYFRYADPKNKEEFASKKQIRKLLPVDLYVGGAEHSVLHLLYSRFFTKVLHSLGHIDFDEPFLKLRHQGIILAEDGRKMSKSLGNVVNPDDIVNEFGADSLRLFEMFMGPLEDMKPWQTQGIIGIKRFFDRLWEHFKRNKSSLGESWEEWLDHERWENNPNKGPTPTEIKIILNKTIKGVTGDIESLKFNTAISKLMIFLNGIYKTEPNKQFPEDTRLEASLSTYMTANDYEKFLIILSPFAPHIAEELWEKLGHRESIFLESWPKYDPELIKDEEIELVIQVNGKLRDRIKVVAEITEEKAKKTAMENEKVKNFIAGKEIIKIIFVKGKLINIVV